MKVKTELIQPPEQFVPFDLLVSVHSPEEAVILWKIFNMTTKEVESSNIENVFMDVNNSKVRTDISKIKFDLFNAIDKRIGFMREKKK